MKPTAVFIPAIVTVVLAVFLACGMEKSPTGPDVSVTSFFVEGKIFENGSGLSGVSVRLTGAGKDTTATTWPSGLYIFTDIPDGTYTITPSKNGYTFTPADITVKVSGVNANAAEIAATLNPYSPEIKDLAFVSIPGGTFKMGEEGIATPVHSVTISGFEMGTYEVTNSQYCEYLNAALASGDIIKTAAGVDGANGVYKGKEYIYLEGTYWAHPEASCMIYFDTAFKVVRGSENRPVVWVTWCGAKAFAFHHGFDLPTEAEWEYACRGGRQNKYGTDDGTHSTSKANIEDSYPIPVGNYPPNPFGLYDMCGNVWEWCHDFYSEDYYKISPSQDPSGPQTGFEHILRGGYWGPDSVNNCHSARRYFQGMLYRSGSAGFRVVRRASPKNY